MAVPCPGCGREYDVALFAFGRTISCACGRRVGIEARVRPARAGEELRFQVDAMLGRLARWLRVLGFDAAWEADIPDERLVRSALAEERWILTRDRKLLEEWRVPRAHLVAAERPFEQLREVVRAFDLAATARPLRRCARCNALLEPAARAAVREHVPAGVMAREERFWRCQGCGHVYWRGSHVRRIERVLRKLGAIA